VRVFDEGGEGGILHGNISLSVDRSAIRPDLNLQGNWHFKTGNCGNPIENEIEFQSWNEILVPGVWEDQGYKNYDGISCYAKQFTLDGQFENKKMVLMLGKIDDLDMVYVNGVLVGQSGDFENAAQQNISEMFNQFRGYYLPEDVLNHKGINTIIVKVYDYWGVGGIWQGDIGLISQDHYIASWRKRKDFYR
jgi:sialate O-acetylesterase